MSVDLSSPMDARYALKGLIGQGGMGEVYRGWDIQLGRAVALKFIHGQDSRQAERLMLEARLQASVLHHHVAQVYEAGLWSGRPCLAMQLVDGPPLDRLAPELSVSTRVQLLKEAAEAIHAAHFQGLLHCDVKPGNILLEPDGQGHWRAIVTDFGLARSLDPTGFSRTQAVGGTLWFMAPELMSPEAPMDVRADVYGLGATLYAILALHPPFMDTTRPGQPKGSASTVSQRADLRRLLLEDPTPLRRMDPAIPKDLESIAAKAMAKDPALRYPSALALAQDLDRFLAGRPILAKPEGFFGRGLRWSRRNPLAARALGMSALTLLISGGLILWNASRTAAATARVSQLGAEGKALEMMLRMGSLEPIHDLRPLLQEVRNRMARLGSLNTGPSTGPAAYALARGHLSLGEWMPALAALHAAEASGIHGPDLASAMAEAHLELFERSRNAALQEPDPHLRETLLMQARREHLDPCLARLKDRSQLPGALRARLAQAEGRLAEARSLARSEQGPGSFEAYRLEGQIELMRQRLASLQGRFAEALEAGESGRKALTEAIRIARSDRASYLLLARGWEIEAGVLRNLQRPRAEALRQGEANLAIALTLDPEWGEALLFKGALAIEEGRGLFSRPQEARERFQTAVASAKAAAIQPGLDRAARELSLWALVNLEYAESAAGLDTRPLVEEGVRIGRELVSTHPNSQDGHRRLASFLVSSAESQPGAGGIPLLQEALDHARIALRLDATTFGPWATFAQTAAALGQAQAMQGLNPEALFQEGLDGLDRFLALQPQNLEAQQTFIQQARVAATFQLKRNRTPDPFLSRALDLAHKLLRAAPGEVDILNQAADLLTIRAGWKLEEGQDPSRDLQEAQELQLQARQRMPGNPIIHQGLGECLLLQAQWMEHNSGDPTALLKAADASLKQSERLNPRLLGTHALQARVHLARARLAARLKRPVLSVVRQGLDEAQRVLIAQPGRSGTRYVQAELLLVAAESASPSERAPWILQAKKALEGLEALKEPSRPLTRFQERLRLLMEKAA